MRFENNYLQQLTLPAGATSAALALPDGEYVLTLAEGLVSTRWEIVRAVVAGGTATLTRGQEGTDDQLWPQGSVIYCGLTAGTLANMLQRLPELGVLDDIIARLEELESPEAGGGDNQFTILTGSVTSGDYSYIGFDATDGVGQIIKVPDLFAGSGGIGLGFMRVEKWGNPEQYAVTASGTSEDLVPAGYYDIAGPGIPSGITVQIFSEPLSNGFAWSFYHELGTTPVAWPEATEITVTITQEEAQQS